MTSKNASTRRINTPLPKIIISLNTSVFGENAIYHHFVYYETTNGPAVIQITGRERDGPSSQLLLTPRPAA